MSDDIIQWLSGDDGFFVHAGILISLLLGGLGIPIPEDVPLLLGGLAASKKIVSFEAIFATCYLGVILSDQIVYAIGFFFGQRILEAGTKSRFFSSITVERVAEIREGLRKKRLLYIFVGRHLFPIRSATFLTAGALRIPFLEFFLADALAALVSVLLMVALGYLLGQTMTPEMINEKTKQLHLYVIAIVAILAFIFMLHRIFKRTQRSNTSKQTNIVEIKTEQAKQQNAVK